MADETGDAEEDVPDPQGGCAMIKSLVAKVDQQNALMQQIVEQLRNPAFPNVSQVTLSRGHITNDETTRNGNSRSPQVTGSPRSIRRASSPGPASPRADVIDTDTCNSPEVTMV